MKRLNGRLFLLFLVSCFVFVSQVCGHEFIINPVKLAAVKGETLPFSVLSSHVFMVSEEVEPVANVSVKLVSGTSEIPVSLSENPTLMTLDGAVTLAGDGTAILSGHRKGMVWTQTDSGWKQAPKNECTGVIKSGKYEKFCKALVTSGYPDKGYAKVLGQTLEIVPVTNPARVSPGDELTVMVLYKGKPLAAEIFATYDGFSDDPNTYAYYSRSGDDGLVRVKVTHDGTWMIRVEKKEETPTPRYDSHVMRAVLVFGVG
ncbi:DUF4198 domain-containing protein [Desulfoluna spongiiphila]|uniref:DUF4198 domain-containing protein n=1 Tax=Desulfoluna spongiiphila TaxID=419481 RepID=UPI001255678E|nr:DUF4198 domain-containing protein [Desulfoluna spongiiphila]VVS93901.1 protein of unknown function duf4198 [Desulfoluna spongiiphila]